MAKIRVSICMQLGCLVFLATSIGLTVVALATWYTNYDFVKDVRSDALLLSASLKSAQVSSALLLMQTVTKQAALRRSPQAALRAYYEEDSNTDDQWNRTAEDFDAVFSGSENSRIAVQARIYHKEGSDRTLFSRTASSVSNIILPYMDAKGEFALMEDHLYGYIPELYPKFNVRAINRTLEHYHADYQGRAISMSSPLLSGPYKVNKHLTLASITVPIVNNTSNGQTIGWLTIALDTKLINDVIDSREGLGNGGISLLVGPRNATNKFPNDYLFDSSNNRSPDSCEVRFQLSPEDTRDDRNGFEFGTAPSFDWAHYPAIRAGFTKPTGKKNNAGSELSSKNERGRDRSVGFAVVNSSVVDWMVVVERPQAEIWAPIKRLRRVILTCVFGTMAGMLAITFPVVHYLSRPVRRLRDATRTSTPARSLQFDIKNYKADSKALSSSSTGPFRCCLSGIFDWYERARFTRLKRKSKPPGRTRFMIPSTVKDGKHFIHDELTELTTTFNTMVDELMTRYEELEARVQLRTAELELSKELAETANRSKTLFIANISHELKTPLNGIMGMLAVCMAEDNPPKLKQSLETIYKSGDLLSNLLTDLLTFREVQIGQHSSLDEKEFRFKDIGSQVLAIFKHQAEQSGISLTVRYEDIHGSIVADGGESSKDITTSKLGLLEDVFLYGDEHLILRVVLNLVSNGLKFSPAGGSVVVTMRCIGIFNKLNAKIASVSSRHSSSLHSSSFGFPPRSGVYADEPTAMTTANASKMISQRAVRSTLQTPHNTMRHFESTSSAEPWFTFEFEVQDTGFGIPQHLHKKIFDPFVQVDLNLNKKYSGAGLGLSICSRLAAMLKGTMRMQSEVGRGSVFVMSIPLKRANRHTECMDRSSSDSLKLDLPMRPRLRKPNLSASDTIGTGNSDFTSDNTAALESQPIVTRKSFRQTYRAANSRPELSQLATAARILVVEDNKTNQEVAIRMLKLEGYHNVALATDGQEAINKVSESMQQHILYNLILMDVQMPNVDGLEATTCIRESGFKGPIVALTAYTDQANKESCLDAGMDDFLTKPILRPALRAVLLRYLPIVDPGEPATGKSTS